MQPHKIFGIKENAEYIDRKGVYIIPEKDGKIGVIQTSKGLFFLGGGLMDHCETEEMCIRRECLEEAGYTVCVGARLCSAETYCLHPEVGYFHPIQIYYAGKLLEQVQDPVETDHKLVWISVDELEGNMFLEMQNWALEQFIKYKRQLNDR